MQQSIQQITYKTYKYAYVRAELTPMESTYHLYIIKVNDILDSRRQEENKNFYIVLQVSLNGFIYRRYHSHRWYYHHHYYSYGIKRDGGRIVNPTTSGGHGFVGGGSCACACACAGGGRDGCSRKDFNRGVIDNKKVLKVLKNK